MKGKRGRIPLSIAPILARPGLDRSMWPQFTTTLCDRGALVTFPSTLGRVARAMPIRV